MNDMGNATFEQFSVLARLAWRARAWLGGHALLDKLIAKDDHFNAYALICSGLDPRSWSTRPEACGLMAASKHSMFHTLADHGFSPAGIFEARLRSLKFNGVRLESVDHVLMDIAALARARCGWSGQGEKALVAAIGLGERVLVRLIDLGAQPDGLGCVARLRARTQRGSDKTIQVSIMIGGVMADANAACDRDIDLLTAFFERHELGLASDSVGSASGSDPKRRL
jgi:hypothetical protein